MKQRLPLFLTTVSLLLNGGLAMAEILSPTLYATQVIDSAKTACEPSEMVSLNHKTKGHLISICHDQYLQCAIDGSCLVQTSKETRLFNVVSFDRRTGLTFFVELNPNRCKYGIGASNICLDPFFSISVDSEIYKMGDVLFVPILKGLKLPTGEVHSGYVVVRDTHELLQGAGPARAVFHTGIWREDDSQNPFAKLELDNPATQVEFKKVNGRQAESIRKARNFPLLPGVSRHEKLLK
jgi:hypothetical protein